MAALSITEPRSTWRLRDHISQLEDVLHGGLEPTAFRDIFHIEFSTFDLLCKFLLEDRNRDYPYESRLHEYVKNRKKSSAEESMVILCGVLYLVSDGSIRESAMILGQAKSTFQRYARLTVSELVRKASEVIKLPKKEDQRFLLARSIHKPMPGAVFALDGTQITLQFKGRVNSFYSRHKKAEINCQVLCDWNMNLVYVMPNYSGRTHDNDAWSQCSLAKELKEHPGEYIANGNYIVADEGYANQGIVIRPYSKKHMTREKYNYNIVHKGARLIVENAIGCWKKRIPSLKTGIHATDPEELVLNVNAAAVLHQFARFHEQTLHVDPVAVEYEHQTFHPVAVFANKTGTSLRSTITTYVNDFYSEELSSWRRTFHRESSVCL